MSNFIEDFANPLAQAPNSIADLLLHLNDPVFAADSLLFSPATSREFNLLFSASLPSDLHMRQAPLSLPDAEMEAADFASAAIPFRAPHWHEHAAAEPPLDDATPLPFAPEGLPNADEMPAVPPSSDTGDERLATPAQAQEREQEQDDSDDDENDEDADDDVNSKDSGSPSTPAKNGSDGSKLSPRVFTLQDGRRAVLTPHMMEQPMQAFLRAFKQKYRAATEADVEQARTTRRRYQLRKSSQKGRDQQRAQQRELHAELERTRRDRQQLVSMIARILPAYVPPLTAEAILRDVQQGLGALASTAQ